MSYWKNRQSKLYSALEKDEEKLKKRLNAYYEKEAAKLEKEIAAFYAKYGENNVIKYREVMKSLNDYDIKLLYEKWDDFAAKYPQYAYLLPVREKIYQLNRLEGLEYSVRIQQLEIGAINNEEFTKHLSKQAQRGANEAAELMGFGKQFYSIDSDIVKMIVDTSWADGKSFSERIWGNTEKLYNYLKTDLAQGFARGDNYSKLVKQIRERFLNVSRNDAYRLVYTEGTYVMAHATIKPFEKDFDTYKVSTAGDSKVCSKCRDISKEEFLIEEKMSGINFPPLHAWCRCSFEIVVNDWDKWMDDYVKEHGDKDKALKIKDKLSKSDESNVKTTPKIIITPLGTEKTLKVYKEKELYEFAHQNEKIIDKYVKKPTKWSGNIRVDKTKSYKDWSCDIVISEETSPMIILHEQLHARSASYISKDLYRPFRTIEEASIQFLTQEICDKEGMEIIGSLYDQYADMLRELNDMSNIYENNLKFAVELHEQKLTDRNDWLEEKVYNSLIKEGDIDKLIRFNDIMTIMRTETPPWK